MCVRGTHRLGNNLKALTRAFWVAGNRSLCFVHLASVREDVADFITVPDEGLFRVFGTNRTFSAERRGRCWGTCWTDICTLSGVKYPLPNLLRRSAQQFLLPHLRCNSTEMSRGTVVMHFRSGDILYGSNVLGRGRIRLKGHYPQPPCAFWLSVLRLGNDGGPFPEALILMEPGFEHPCLDVVVNGTSADVRVQSSKIVAHDACTMVAARHLAIGFGTWGVELGRLNKRLLSLHVPFADDGVRLWEYQSYHLKDWLRSDVVYEGGMPYAQHLYSFPGFYSNQTHYPEKRAALLRYEEKDVVRRSIGCACNSSAGGGG